MNQQLFSSVLCLLLSAPALATDWTAYNRNVQLQAHVIQQHYFEPDIYGLSSNGVLNRESGDIPGVSLTASWQGQVKNVTLWSQVALNWAQGQTDYDGNLQSGNTLTPFQAKTGNTIKGSQARIGLPFTVIDNRVQLIPFVELGYQEWQRNLLQYGETYRQSTAKLGLIGQFALGENWSLDTELAWGKQLRSNLAISGLNVSFDQPLDKHETHQLRAQLNRQLSANWRANVALQYQQNHLGNSAVQNGLQYPSGNRYQNTISLGVSYVY